jgi:hypothetical protein
VGDSNRIVKVLAGAAIAAYFFLLTHEAVHAYFTPDDMMNLYRSWIYPLKSLVKANLLFFESSPFYRPMGSAWYRTIFYFAGFNPAPFHAVNLAVLAANIFLTYAVARRLSGSAEIGAMAALLGSYHTSFAFLYFDTGFVYDVLCYFFFFSALLVYLRVRQRDQPLNAAALVACSVLYICALGSKEMAVTFPLFLLIYELLYHPPKTTAVRWALKEGRGVLATGLITAAFVIGRFIDPNSLARHPAYALVFTWERFMETSRTFVSGLFFDAAWVTPVSIIVLWTAMFAAAWLARSKPLKFAWLFLMLSVAPVAFTAPRGPSQYYLVLFGWVLFAATLLVQVSAYVSRRSNRAVLLFCTTMLFLFANYKALGWSNVWTVKLEGPVIHGTAWQLHQLYPSLPHGTRILFLEDPFGVNYGDMLFITRLSYNDASIVVDRVKTMDHTPDAAELASYDHVIDFKDGRFVEVAQH